MAVALIFSISGGGKTVNSTRVTGGYTYIDEATGKLKILKSRGKNLLLSSDFSHIVLNNFTRPNLDVEVVKGYLKTDKEIGFIEQFEKAINSNKYDTVICDNISTLFDTAILEMAESGKYADMRKAYQIVYMAFKRLIRLANQAKCNVVFTAWCDYEETMSPSGEMIKRAQPKIPIKILDSFCGLCNIVGQVVRNKEGEYGFALEGTPNRYAKDQIYCRKACKPEDLFINNGGKK